MAEIGAHEHESYYAFDICYNNTSDVTPTTITGEYVGQKSGQTQSADFAG
jgi:hypothetical protein